MTELETVFPTRESPSSDAPKAAAGGTLIVDERDCLRLSNPTGARLVPIWPYGYELVKDESGEILVLDEKGKAVARVGDEVQVDGASLDGVDGTTFRPGQKFLDEQKVRELTERCSGSYWIVGNQIPSPPPTPAEDK